MTENLSSKQRSKIDFSKCTRDKFGVIANNVKMVSSVPQKLPAQIRDEIPTLNRMGYMKVDFDLFSEEFIDYAAKTKEVVLELGCAYGFVVKKVLEKGVKIIANDLGEEHLTVLLETTPKEYLNNLRLYSGAFPDDIELPKESIAAVLTSRMMHFLDGETIERGLDKISSWLMPGGKFFFGAVTPYHMAFRERFLSVYQGRVANGDEWPGIIEDQWELNPDHKEYVGQYLHVFDIPQLETLLPKHGFKIEKIKLFDYPNDIDSQSKGHVGFVASKI